VDALIQEFEAIAKRVFEREFSQLKLDQQHVFKGTAEAISLRERLEYIKAKENVSISEAALLLNCSDGHVRNLVGKAKKQQTRQPIPFTDLDGVTVFNRVALLEWANTPKHKLRAVDAKDESANQ
jgi:hypothetical protein